MACRRLPCALKVASAAPQSRLLVACRPVRVVGGGIVDELAETWDKAQAFSRVLA